MEVETSRRVAVKLQELQDESSCWSSSELLTAFMLLLSVFLPDVEPAAGSWSNSSVVKSDVSPRHQRNHTTAPRGKTVCISPQQRLSAALCRLQVDLVKYHISNWVFWRSDSVRGLNNLKPSVWTHHIVSLRYVEWHYTTHEPLQLKTDPHESLNFTQPQVLRLH